MDGPTGISVGTPKDSIVELHEAIKTILFSGVTNRTKRAALVALVKVGRVSHVTITGATITMAPASRDLDEDPRPEQPDDWQVGAPYRPDGSKVAADRVKGAPGDPPVAEVPIFIPTGSYTRRQIDQLLGTEPLERVQNDPGISKPRMTRNPTSGQRTLYLPRGTYSPGELTALLELEPEEG